jgi:hypothetical protein
LAERLFAAGLEAGFRAVGFDLVFAFVFETFLVALDREAGAREARARGAFF